MEYLKRELRALISDHKGSMSMTALAFCIVLMFLSLIMLEGIRFYETYYSMETSIQRSLTSAVEMNMDYRYRAEHLLYLYIDEAPQAPPSDSTGVNYEEVANLRQGRGAWVDFLDFLEADLGADRSGTTFTRKTASGKTAFIVEITSHGGNNMELCEKPKMTISGRVTIYPIFAALPGAEPIITDFVYESQNFRIDGR